MFPQLTGHNLNCENHPYCYAYDASKVWLLDHIRAVDCILVDSRTDRKMPLASGFDSDVYTSIKFVCLLIEN